MVALSSFSASGNKSVSPRIMIESIERSRKIRTNAAIQMVSMLGEAIRIYLLMSFKNKSLIIPDRRHAQAFFGI